MYELAKEYFEHHGNLKIFSNFKTINGYEPNENGVALGNWIRTQRQAYRGNGTCKINEFLGKTNPEIFITDYHITKNVKYYF